MTATDTIIRTLSDVECIEKTPLSDRQLAQSTYAVFQRSANSYGEKIALRFLPTSALEETPVQYTYAELHNRITQAANAFTQLGIQETDVVSLLLPNLPQTHFALWGAQAIGIANPINPMLSTSHIIHILNAVKAKILVTMLPMKEAQREKMNAILANTPTLKTVLTINLNTHTPAANWQHNILTLDFDEVLSQQQIHQLISERRAKPNDIACYFHTGGTTGMPKIAMQSHLNQVFSAWMVGLQLQWTESDVMHCGLPLFHVNAPLISGLAPFMVGGEVLLTSPQGFRSETVIMNFWKLVEKYRISFFMAVPTVYIALNKTWHESCDTSSLKIAACGAAPMPTALIHEFESKTNIRILEGYGLTEGTVFSSANPAFGKRLPGSIGMRIPYQSMKAVKLDNEGNYQRDCKLHEIGNLVIKGPNVFKGYLETADNQHTWIDNDWLNTGDLGKQDENGYFWLSGRSKDLIIRGGHNIDPRIIEEALSKHPAVASVAAVGKPDSKMGETPAAYVCLHEGKRISAKELEIFAAKNISEHVATPKSIYIIPEMPLTAVGKIYKPDLRADIIKRSIEEKLAHLSDEINMQIMVQLHPEKGMLATIKFLGEISADMIQRAQNELKFFNIAIEIN